MAVRAPATTAEELWNLHDDGLRRELVEGELRVILGRLMDAPPAPTLWGPVGFLNRESSRELDPLLKPYTDSLGLRAQPADLAAAMQAAAREITVMLSPALRHHSPRRQAAA
jgi:hypothetical protein